MESAVILENRLCGGLRHGIGRRSPVLLINICLTAVTGKRSRQSHARSDSCQVFRLACLFLSPSLSQIVLAVYPIAVMSIGLQLIFRIVKEGVDVEQTASLTSDLGREEVPWLVATRSIHHSLVLRGPDSESRDWHPFIMFSSNTIRYSGASRRDGAHKLLKRPHGDQLTIRQTIDIAHVRACASSGY